MGSAVVVPLEAAEPAATAHDAHARKGNPTLLLNVRAAGSPATSVHLRLSTSTSTTNTSRLESSQRGKRKRDADSESESGGAAGPSPLCRHFRGLYRDVSVTMPDGEMVSCCITAAYVLRLP